MVLFRDNIRHHQAECTFSLTLKHRCAMCSPPLSCSHRLKGVSCRALRVRVRAVSCRTVCCSVVLSVSVCVSRRALCVRVHVVSYRVLPSVLVSVCVSFRFLTCHLLICVARPLPCSCPLSPSVSKTVHHHLSSILVHRHPSSLIATQHPPSSFLMSPGVPAVWGHRTGSRSLLRGVCVFATTHARSVLLQNKERRHLKRLRDGKPSREGRDATYNSTYNKAGKDHKS